MTNRKKPILYLSLLILLTIFPFRIAAQQEESDQSLNQDLSHYSIPELEVLAFKNIYTLTEASCYKVILQKGLNANSLPDIYKGLDGLLNYYYYDMDLDNLDRWISFTDSLIEARKVNPDLYYDAHRNRASLLLELKEFEQAINETIGLYNKAEKTNQSYGIACSSELLGNIYLSCQQDSAAIFAYQSAYDQLKKLGRNPSYQIKVMSCLLETHFRLGNLKEIEVLLKEYDQLITQNEKEQKQREGFEEKTNWFRWQLHSFYADLYLRKGEMDKALEALNESSSYYKEGMTANAEFSIYYYLYIKASYLKKTKKYTEALATVNFILKDFPEPLCIKLKISILHEMGHFQETLPLFDDLFQMTKKRNSESFVHQVNNLQVLHEKYEQQIQEKKLKLTNYQIEAKRRLLSYTTYVSIAFLLFVCILSIFLIHTFRMKRELEKGKNKLLISQEQLKQERIKVKKVDQEKDTFIANISHEIRTPLNVIVGFSTLLSEMEFEKEEQKEFVELIEKNSSLLLNLVNDVLDLSRLESGRTKIAIAPCELTQCCQTMLDGIKDQLSTEVRLVFSPSVSPFMLETDSRLLSQLLLNLLNNSVKFTEQGEISLAYETNDTERKVTFFITDTGPGIPLDKQQVIFERFLKLNEYSQGSGLGLSLCQAIAQKLNGSISIDTSYTTGARFLFVHPY